MAGKVSSRRAACHQCDACWAGNRHECENLDFTGRPTHLLITHKDAPTAGVQRMERAALNRDGVSRAEKAEAGSIVCIETHEDEQAHPWVISEVTKTIHEAPAASTPYNPAKDSIHFEPVKAKEPVLEVKLLDTLAPGSTTYFYSELTVLVPARRVRVIKVELEPVRSSNRQAAAANAHISGARERFKITDDSLLAIRAEDADGE